MSDIPVPGFNAGAFIGNMIENNVGVTAARNAMRAAGMKMSNAAFSSLYGQIREAIGAREGLQGLDYESLPSGETYSTWTAGRGDQYATFVTTWVRPIGERDASPRYFYHLTNEPHTPAEAVRVAQSSLAQAAEAEHGDSDIMIIGSLVTSINRTLGRR